jgi:hypothetical protein
MQLVVSNFQAYKQHNKVGSWSTFCLAVHKQFGSDDYRLAMTDLIQLRQIGTVEEPNFLYFSPSSEKNSRLDLRKF